MGWKRSFEMNGSNLGGFIYCCKRQQMDQIEPPFKLFISHFTKARPIITPDHQSPRGSDQNPIRCSSKFNILECYISVHQLLPSSTNPIRTLVSIKLGINPCFLQ